MFGRIFCAIVLAGLSMAEADTAAHRVHGLPNARTSP